MTADEMYDLLQADIKEIKGDIAFLRTVSLPKLTDKLDETATKVTKLEIYLDSKFSGQYNSSNKMLSKIIFLLIGALLALAGTRLTPLIESLK